MDDTNVAYNPDKPPDSDVLVSLMEDSIGLMEFGEKKSYLEAVGKCPEIVETESDFVNFLLFDGFDIWKAAKRLLKYWENRVRIFEERAFHSLFDLTGNGALDELDLQLLVRKANVILPNDTNGSAVILSDASRYEGIKVNPNRNDRQAFFLTEVLAFQQRHEGKMVPVGSLLTLPVGLPRWLLSKNKWTDFYAGHTVKCTSLKYLILSKDKPEKAWFQAIFPTFQSEVAKRTSKDDFGKVEIYCDDTEEGLKLKLTSLGLTEKGLPPSLGGTWSYDSFSFFTRVPAILENTKCRVIVTALLKQPEQSTGTDSETIGTPPPPLIESAIAAHQSQMKTFLYSSEIDEFPYHDRISWINAQRNPELAQQDSLLPQFYRYHDCVPFKAAEHLFSYWRLREKYFCERAFLHMNQVGIGSLDRFDIPNLVSGFLALLSTDCDGNHVVFYDPSRLPKYVAVPQKRILFYIIYVALERSLKERTKIKFLIYLNEEESMRKKLCLSDVIDAFPLDVISYHLILKKEGLMDETYRDRAMSKVCSLFDCSADQIVVHTVVSELGGSFLGDELAVYGLKDDNIPASFGGKWNERQFLIWRDERIRYETAYRCEETFRSVENWESLRRRLGRNAISSGENSRSARKKTGKRSR